MKKSWKIAGMIVAAIILVVALTTITYKEGTQSGEITENQPPIISIESPPSHPSITAVIVGKENITVEGTASDPDGSIQHVEVRFAGDNWTVADGTESWKWNTTVHESGNYTVEARSYDGILYSSVASTTFKVHLFASNHPPDAIFRVITQFGEKVAFRDTSNDLDGYIVNRTWDFGDGTTEEIRGASWVTHHVYSTPGTYTVSLTVWDDDGAKDTMTKSVTVTK